MEGGYSIIGCEDDGHDGKFGVQNLTLSTWKGATFQTCWMSSFLKSELAVVSYDLERFLGGFYFKWVYSWITIAIKLMFNLVKKRLRCFTEIFFKRNYIYICLTAVPSVSSYWASQAASEDGLRQQRCGIPTTKVLTASRDRRIQRDPPLTEGRVSKNDKWLM